jgi:hypothetical protein
MRNTKAPRSAPPIDALADAEMQRQVKHTERMAQGRGDSPDQAPIDWDDPTRLDAARFSAAIDGISSGPRRGQKNRPPYSIR